MINFGDSSRVVATKLKRILGTSSSAGAGGGGSTGLVRGICGFDHEIDWAGLAVKSRSPILENGQPVVFAATLDVYFKRGAFVGYNYFQYRTLQRDARDPAAAGPRLATTKGLSLSDTLAQARRLYGPALVSFTQLQGTPHNPRLDRTTAWKTPTRTGLIDGSLEITPPQHRVSKQSTIASISAGEVPNTPCASRSDRSP
jgi:hypothetical protein